MPSTLDQILAFRRQRITGQQRARYAAFSVFTHLLVIAVTWFVPDLFAKPPEPFEAVSVFVVPPSALGVEEPPPPPPPRVEPPPPEPPPPEPPPPEPPPPEPPPPDVPVLVEEQEQKPERKPEVKPKVQPPPPPPPAAPPKRKGSPFGKALGASSNKATIGVEDPNFTYGYYLNQVVGQISQNWSRPPVGSEIKQALFHFRIERNGTITDLRLVEPSKSDIFDRKAERAIEASSPLPPLPKSYKQSSLGINLIIK